MDQGLFKFGPGLHYQRSEFEARLLELALQQLGIGLVIFEDQYFQIVCHGTGAYSDGWLRIIQYMPSSLMA